MRCCTEPAVVSSLPALCGCRQSRRWWCISAAPSLKTASQLRQRHFPRPKHSRSSRERCPMPGRGTNCRHGEGHARQLREALKRAHLYKVCIGGICAAERGARAGPVRSVGGRGCGERRSPPFARDSARPRAPERLVCEGVGCGAGCGTRCGAPAPARPREGGAAVARGRAGGGSVSGRRSARAAPRPLARARRSEKAAVDVVARLFSAHCPPTASRWSRAAATNQTRGRNCNL